MTERECMISGKLYNPYMISDNPWAEIRAACKKYNESDFWSDRSAILDENAVIFGGDVFLGPHVSIYAARNPLSAEVRNLELEYAKAVKIGDSVWIGGNVVINPGVTIGDDVVIGSGSVVTKDIPSHVIAAGFRVK